MKILILLAATVVLLAAVAGCTSDTGSREYIPGKGWVPTQ